MDFSAELKKAKLVADFAIRTKSNSSKDVKNIGLKSAISNQILRKYRRKRIKKATSVKLTIPGQSVKFADKIRIPCLGVDLPAQYLPDFERIRQLEIGKEFAHISVEKQEPATIPADHYIGVDCNTTGHCAVAAVPHTGKVYKLGKKAIHIHKKYRDIRKRLQRQGKYQLLRQIKTREKNIVRDLNHKISKKLVEIAVSEKSGIRFERLTGIRQNRKQAKSFRYSINSWSYYQLQKYTEYKARMCGIEVAHVAPAYTSKSCSICGTLGERTQKKFSCPRCGHVDHADVNAAFNIGRPVTACMISHCATAPAVHIPKVQNMSLSCKERDLHEGSTDTPHAAIARMQLTVEPRTL
jgi:putative transposase